MATVIEATVGLYKFLGGIEKFFILFLSLKITLNLTLQWIIRAKYYGRLSLCMAQKEDNKIVDIKALGFCYLFYSYH